MGKKEKESEKEREGERRRVLGFPQQKCVGKSLEHGLQHEM